MPRLFVAVDLSVAVVERIVASQRELASRLGDVDVRWVAAPNIHVTLKFLGDVEEAVVPILAEALGALARPLFPFEIRCCRLGGFPDLAQPRILWAGLDGKGAEVMGLLQQTVERDLAELGFPREGREYRPHITIGRVRDSAVVDSSQIADLVDLDFGSGFIKDIALFESVPTRDGVEYVVRRRFSLGEA